MKKNLICVRGAGDTGKTTALRKIMSVLIEKGATVVEWIEPTNCDERTVNGDFTAILEYKSLKIGFKTQCDPTFEERVIQAIKQFIEVDCDLVLCASRTRGGTCAAVAMFDEAYDINWFSTKQGSYIDQNALWNAVENTINKILENKKNAYLL